ncbi:hypothetical protein GTY81_17870 [Streptomyces sp. SID8366]|uniref:hypothetical protein n=1 Tax=unclassified Streptomyces TaxID=2593676 RepID=UPI000DBAB160|nr:hypothetical protein [Streptomyces sp. PsTaAH-130]MYU05713.1 hypothetical protein [Streptomyces sp. SID8366]MYU65833.1 hypothetical protein [Streptomyces sp. SID69]RAJ63762.1 hypothetical protein K376_00857 [Streptomyces sp. PsTaAH-130]
MAAIAAAAALAPALLGATPAAADEALDTALSMPDRSPEEDAAKTRAATAPDLRLEEAPKVVEAGGDWAGFSVVLDNAHDGGEVWTLDMSLNTDGPRLYGDDLRVQVHIDGAWRDARVLSDPELGNYDLALREAFSLPAGRTTVPVRIRAGSDAPLTEFFIGPRIFDGHVQSDPGYWVESKITAPAEEGEKPGGGDEPGEGQEPGGGGEPGEGQGPGGGDKPGNAHHSGTNHPREDDMSGGGGNATGPGASSSSNGGSGAAASLAEHPDAAGDDSGRTAANASLAETGSDVSGPLLGIGGASIALGTALVAARRLRRNSS